MDVNIRFEPDTAPDSFAGIVFGYQDSANFYVFGIQPSGHYAVHLKLGGEWQDSLVQGYWPPLAENAVEMHQLSLTYDAGLYTILLNENLLTPFYSDTLDAGEFGLYARTVSGTAQIAFDDFAIYDLTYAEPDVEGTSEPEDEAEDAEPDDGEGPSDGSADESDNNGDGSQDNNETIPPPRI